MGTKGQSKLPRNIYARAGIYWARFKVAGREYRESLRTRSESVAVKRLKARLDEVNATAHFGEAGPVSWPHAVMEWLEHGTSEIGATTLKRYQCSLKQLHPWLSDKLLSKIDTALVREIVKGRRKLGATTATIKRDLTAMSGVIEYAMEEEWMDHNPTLSIRRKRLKERRDPILLPEEASIRTMLAASPQRFADAQEFARITGMRQDEIFSLERTAIKGKEITIVGKRNKMRVIPYTPEARAIVERQPAFLGSPFVFYHDDGERWSSPGSRFADIRRRVAQKAAQAGKPFTQYRFHDLRHLYAVEYLRQKRGSVYDLKELLGHTSVKTTEIYLEYLTPEQKKAAIHGVAQKAARGKRSGER